MKHITLTIVRGAPAGNCFPSLHYCHGKRRERESHGVKSTLKIAVNITEIPNADPTLEGFVMLSSTHIIMH